jgi:16S rRNA (guanine966-N2)-methyltransferase
MSRVIAGSARGRRLVMPPGDGTRPTAARAREGLFSTLTALFGEIDGCAFLDLYAGSGAVGLEAASRGAARVLLVEQAPEALRAMAANMDTLGLAGVERRTDDVMRVVAQPAGAGFDLVFIDPPYSEPVADLLTSLASGGWLAADAIVCVERATRDRAAPWPAGYEALRSRKYGEGTLWYGRAS